MDLKNTLAFVAAAATWKAMSKSTSTTNGELTPQQQQNGHGEEKGIQCPVTGKTLNGSSSGCPVSNGFPKPDPGHRCETGDIEETKIPDVPPLTQKQREIIKSTAPILAEHGVTITTHFYKNMIRAHPELRDVFSESSQKLGHQPRALAAAVYAYACNIDDLTPLLPVVDRIAYKHTSLHIVAEQYGIVGKHLIQSIVDILGDAVTPEIGDAWFNGYWNLAKIFINREREFYTTAVENGGWEGWKQFKVTQKIKESDEITSFYLKPLESIDSGKSLPKYHPGQYIAVSLYIPSLGYKQARQYSLSDRSNGEYFRISVKREDGVAIPTKSNPVVPSHPGWMSNLLHEKLHEGSIIDVASPYGDFFYEPSLIEPNAPLVLISAGVGQTALLSILNSQLENKEKPINYITVARNKKVHAFGNYIRGKVLKENPNVSYKVFYSSPEEGSDLSGKDYDVKGRMNLNQIKDNLYLDDKSTEYYLCGPEKFMVDKLEELKSFGIDEKRIHIELFAAGELPQTA
ncbi:uncharacterized protein L201_002340 [Kwoniella dendrophila CBS 6074]|uniref:nitric oxide dioxygenase n=1 Tax=Kwoniella dendrophila CBS 6074 TaxID=1295534 RepID=A0AAX4JPX1_9TREE